MNINPKLDLVVTKTLDITPDKVWKAWTTPERYGEWFCPKPWKVAQARLDLRPGGEFYTVIQSPEGDKFPGMGCVLEVVPNKKLVWTNALLPDFRPAGTEGIVFTAEIHLEADGNKTKYTAIGRHGNEEGCKQHAEMGFVDGWGICVDQLVEMMKK